MNTSNENQQGGYDWSNGMSNRAVGAYDRGLLPASKAASALAADGIKVDATFVRRHFTAAEWHHTSKKFNATDFFNVAEIAARIADSAALQAAVAEYALEKKAALAARREQSAGYLADVTITEFERIVLNRFGKLGGWRPIFRTLRGVKVNPVSECFVEIAGEGRVKIGSKLAIVKLAPEEIRRRKNLASAAKRKATIAARKVMLAVADAMRATLAAHAAPRLLALPAPARRSAPWFNCGYDAIRHELGRGYAFDREQRGHVHSIACRVARREIEMEAARAEVARLALSWTK